MTSPQLVLRIVDANLNRLGEGLRLLEDIARLLLNDASLTGKLKTMRHELVSGDPSFNQRLIRFRSSETDVGMDIEVPGMEKERNLPLAVVANSRRVQESLRTLEEVAKMPDIPLKLDSDKFKHARFELYEIEQELLSRLIRSDKVKRISGLYVIIDTQALKRRSHIEVTGQAIRGGARIIQLRDKLLTKKELLPIAQELKALCFKHNVLFIMNDYLDIALACEADGLHIGQDDLPVKVARKLLPVDMLLGCSAKTVEEAVTAVADGADHIGIGAMYPTGSKEQAEVIGLAGLRQIRQAVSVPIVAIGGITGDNCCEVIAAGADSVAVINAVLGAASCETAVRQIIKSLKGEK